MPKSRPIGIEMVPTTHLYEECVERVAKATMTLWRIHERMEAQREAAGAADPLESQDELISGTSSKATGSEPTETMVDI
jgi:hypothetical protein